MDVSLVPFDKAHLEQLKTWTHHEDVLLKHYDFKGFMDNDYSRWFRRKQRLLTKKLYAVIAEEALVGFITMKRINRLKRQAEMGIVFDPGRVNKGLGTKGVELFLKMFFEELGFEVLLLHVADFNRRAMKCYTKTGFTIVSSIVEPFEDQSRNFELLLAGEGVFHLDHDRLMTLVHTMKITKTEYEQRLKD
ncbi:MULTISPECIES: GNAT family N-acetyltransferase [unclassified Fusibacter]|uniref:GNAT family N-acetyltransferase n=1 Tax=unclassified Fusibacter TaxID=2624464 RepID=UPI001011E885|nr:MULTISPECIES: GNAT family N-acetyltransferase [unclassified Fusibacter]MCK8060883.1 GNAT family N-acetyltransferase [Fusibacter sp. A2]NPE23179.1 GNAT family N-acetyltransferase [Fusibacter sp. A1]RXV59537.1 N-acetyltransferase [Fusibacter sp. A1]